MLKVYMVCVLYRSNGRMLTVQLPSKHVCLTSTVMALTGEGEVDSSLSAPQSTPDSRVERQRMP